QQTVLRIAGAREQINQAGGAFFPSVNGHVQATRQQLGLESVSAETLDARWAGGPEGDDVEGALAGVVERYLTMWAGGNSGVVPGL
ncbi:hypothetical protein QP626_15100, partial [Enterococcus faecalis]|uniref:hypothetical protein n=1 Tax=Enterococcus faecalis TaxID=1351 RepID=UPI00254AD1C3